MDSITEDAVHGGNTDSQVVMALIIMATIIYPLPHVFSPGLCMFAMLMDWSKMELDFFTGLPLYMSGRFQNNFVVVNQRFANLRFVCCVLLYCM